MRRARELNLRVWGLSRTSNPTIVGHAFLSEQLDILDITLDRCWFGTGAILFIRFFSFPDRLHALRAKRKLFSLPSKIYLYEDLTKTQVAKFK